jgi:hypothetical protein
VEFALVVTGAASAGDGVVGHLYLNDNTTGVNTIAAFDRHADGNAHADGRFSVCGWR